MPNGVDLTLSISIPETTLASGITSFSSCGSAADATATRARKEDTPSKRSLILILTNSRGKSSQNRRLSDNFDAEPFQRYNFAGMLHQQPNSVKPKIAQDLRPDPGLVLHRPLALSLAAMRNQPAVGLKPEPQSSLMQIDQHAQTLRGNLAQRACNRLLAIALRG